MGLIIKNILQQIVDKTLTLIYGLIIGGLVARYLGVEQTGLLNYIIGITTLLLAFSRFGLNNVVLRHINTKNNAIIFDSIIISSFAALILYLTTSTYLYFYEVKYFKFFLIYGIVLFIQPLDVLEIYYTNTHNSKVILFTKISTIILISVIKLLGIYYLLPVSFFLFANLLFFIIVGFTLLIKFSKSEHHYTISYYNLKGLLEEALPFYLASIFTALFMKINIVFIEKLHTNYEIGIFSVVTTLISVSYFIPQIISNVFAPRLFKSSSVIADFRTLAMVTLILSFILVVVYSSIGPLIINLIYGDEFSDAIQYLQFFSLTIFFVGIESVRRIYFVMYGLERILLISNFAGAASSVFLGYFFIKQFEISGAIIATLISYSISHIFTLLLFKKTRSFLWIFLTCYKSVPSIFKFFTPVIR